MSRTRRRFLEMFGFVGLSVSVAPFLGASVVSLGAPDERKGGLRVEDLQRETFEPLVDSTFLVSNDDGGEARFKLVEVSGGKTDPRLEQFSLLFEASADVVLEQGTYWFEHSALGRQPLFLVPVGLRDAVRLYEVGFCRLIN